MNIDCLVNSSKPDGSFHISFLLNEKSVLSIERNMIENEYKGKIIYNVNKNLNTYVDDFLNSPFNHPDFITYYNIDNKLNDMKRKYAESINNVTSYINSDPAAARSYINTIANTIIDSSEGSVSMELAELAAKSFIKNWCSDNEKIIVNNQEVDDV